MVFMATKAQLSGMNRPGGIAGSGRFPPSNGMFNCMRQHQDIRSRSRQFVVLSPSPPFPPTTVCFPLLNLPSARQEMSRSRGGSSRGDMVLPAGSGSPRKRTRRMAAARQDAIQLLPTLFRHAWRTEQTASRRCPAVWFKRAHINLDLAYPSAVTGLSPPRAHDSCKADVLYNAIMSIRSLPCQAVSHAPIRALLCPSAPHHDDLSDCVLFTAGVSTSSSPPSEWDLWI